jgi:hypothetical protein
MRWDADVDLPHGGALARALPAGAAAHCEVGVNVGPWYGVSGARALGYRLP